MGRLQEPRPVLRHGWRAGGVSESYTCSALTSCPNGFSMHGGAPGGALSPSATQLLSLRGGTLLGGVADPSSLWSGTTVGKATAAVMSNFLAICVLGGYLARVLRQSKTTERVHQLRTTGKQSTQAGDLVAAPSMTILVPCYLPNEQEIVKDTIEHIMERVEYPDGAAFHLLVAYNTPEPMAFEAELHEWIEQRRLGWQAKGRRVQLMKVEGSTSKAENLNAALATEISSDLTAIFDADHHPNSDALLRSTSRLLSDDADCVQGSIFLRSQPDVWAKLVHAEFFVTHFVYFPAMAFGARTGFFAGSNAVWRTDTLRRRPFRKGMQTEDIDFSMRVLLEDPKARISFCPESRSGELPCASLGALWKQRLRWATGWDEVTLDHAGRIWNAPMSLAKRLGMYYMLPLRWLALVSVIVSQVALVAGLRGRQVLEPIATPILRAGAFCGVVTVLNALAYEGPSSWMFIAAFLVLSPVYAAFNLALVVTSLARIATGTVSGWDVTARYAGFEGGADGGADGGAAQVRPVEAAGTAHSLKEPAAIAPAMMGHLTDTSSRHAHSHEQLGADADGGQQRQLEARQAEVQNAAVPP